MIALILLLLIHILIIHHVQAQEDEVCFNFPGWKSLCLWYEGEPTDDTVLISRCDSWGNFGAGIGDEVANDACCVCGGGYKTNSVPSMSPSVSIMPTTYVETCYDWPGWHDLDGEKFNCKWYGLPVGDDDDYYQEGDTKCNRFGSYGSEFGSSTAKQACCVCGGGFLNTKLVPSVSPSLSFKPTVSRVPSSVPSVSLKPSAWCVDIPNWFDSDGPVGNCDWYSNPVGDDDDYYEPGDTRCDLYGNGFANFDRTASQACCVCGGGISRATGYEPPSINPASAPHSLAPTRSTVKPTSSPLFVESHTPSHKPSTNNKVDTNPPSIRIKNDDNNDDISPSPITTSSTGGARVLLSQILRCRSVYCIFTATALAFIGYSLVL